MYSKDGMRQAAGNAKIYSTLIDLAKCSPGEFKGATTMVGHDCALSCKPEKSTYTVIDVKEKHWLFIFCCHFVKPWVGCKGRAKSQR
jgi:hypothetical protein